MLGADVPRNPSEQLYPNAGPIRRSADAIVLEQLRPPRRMVLFGYGKLFEYLCAMRIGFCLRQCAIQGNAFLFLYVVRFVATNVGVRGGHALDFTPARENVHFCGTFSGRIALKSPA